MVQLAHVTTLIFCLLVCPLRCMGVHFGVEVAQESPTREAKCCGQCATHNHAATPHDDSGQPDDAGDCDCGSCLCHGGWVDEPGVEFPNSIGPGWTFVSQVTAPLPVEVAGAPFHSCHFPHLRSGREICALTCSLLR